MNLVGIEAYRKGFQELFIVFVRRSTIMTLKLTLDVLGISAARVNEINARITARLSHQVKTLFVLWIYRKDIVLNANKPIMYCITKN